MSLLFRNEAPFKSNGSALLPKKVTNLVCCMNKQRTMSKDSQNVCLGEQNRGILFSL